MVGLAELTSGRFWKVIPGSPAQAVAECWTTARRKSRGHPRSGSAPTRQEVAQGPRSTAAAAHSRTTAGSRPAPAWPGCGRVRSGQGQRGDLVPHRDQHQIGFQGREQRAASGDGLPLERDMGARIGVGQVVQADPGHAPQPGPGGTEGGIEQDTVADDHVLRHRTTRQTCHRPGSGHRSPLSAPKVRSATARAEMASPAALRVVKKRPMAGQA
jgi:hypothetical protein